jgi:hypothetical protein
MKRFQELTIITPNRPGELADALRAIAHAKIDVLALDSSAGYDLNLVRLVTNDGRRVKNVLAKLGFAVREADLLGVTLSDKPGQLAAVTAALGKARVNIDYVYGTGNKPGQEALFLFHVSDLKAGERALKAAGFC